MSEDPADDVLSGLRVCKVTGAYVGVDGGDNGTVEVYGKDLEPGNVDLISHIPRRSPRPSQVKGNRLENNTCLVISRYLEV